MLCRAGFLPVRKRFEQGRDHRAAVLGDDPRRGSRLARARDLRRRRARGHAGARGDRSARVPRLRLRSGLASSKRGGPDHDLLHVGNDGAAKGRRADPRQRALRVPRRGGGGRRGARGSYRLLPPPCPHGRPLRVALHADALRHAGDGDRGRQGSRRGAPGGPSDELRLGATGLGEDEGRPGGGDRGRRGPGPQTGGEMGDRHGPAARAGRAGGRPALGGAARRMLPGR